MRRRVLFLTSLFPTEAEPFKAPFVVRIIRALMVSAVEGTLLAPVRWDPRAGRRDTGQARAQYASLTQGLQPIRPRLFLTPYLGRSLHWLFYFACIYRTASRVIRDRQVEFIYVMYAYPDGVAGILVGLCTRTPVIVRTMGCDINLFTQQFLKRHIIRCALKRAFHIVAVSTPMKATLVALGIPPERITVIYNGVDRSVFTPMDMRECRHRLQLPNDEKSILFVGGLEEVKDTPALIEAFGRLTQTGTRCHLYIVGDGPLRSTIERQVRAKALDGSVTLLGERASPEIALWMNACNVLCLPSIREGAPNVIIEALSCHRPVVATAVGGTPELLSLYQAGLCVQPRDPDALADALRTSLDTEFSADARTPRREFTWERMAEEFTAILG